MIDRTRRAFVYFVHSPDHKLIKLGTTKDQPDVRFRSLVTSSPAPLVKLGVIRGGWHKEQDLHAKFDHLRRPNGEWFHESDDLWAYIRRYANPWPVKDAYVEPGPEFFAKRTTADVEREILESLEVYWVGRTLAYRHQLTVVETDGMFALA